MMIEYEIKYQANRSMLSQVIEDLSYVGQKQQNDTYYDTPNYTLFLNAVFLRKRNDKIIDIKYNFDKTDTSHLFCNETSFKLPLSGEAKKSFDVFLSQLIRPAKNDDDIFKKYQLKEFVVINKNREIYRGNDIEVSFDIVENLGEFIEIEAKTEKGINDIKKHIHSKNIQRIPTGYVELYLENYNYNLYKKGKYLNRMNMERHFFTTKYACPNKCQYCFEAFNTYPFPAISYAEVEHLNNCIIYPACNTEILCIDKLSHFFEEYISKSKHFNIFSFSTKNNIKESDLSLITEINNKLKEKNIGEIKISISLSNKYKIHEIEQGTATYKERLSLAEKLYKNEIKTTVIIKPVLPYIAIAEYKEIIDDFVSIGVCHFVTGNLYFKENTPFFDEYIKDKGYDITSKNIHWIKNAPTWQQINSNDTIQELSEYIKSLKGFHYHSDKELIENLF